MKEILEAWEYGNPEHVAIRREEKIIKAKRVEAHRITKTRPTNGKKRLVLCLPRDRK